MKQIYYPVILRVITQLKDKNVNVQALARRLKINWSQLNTILNLLYMYDLIDIDDTVKPKSFNLTSDGREVRFHLWKIEEIIGANRRSMMIKMFGYNTKQELIGDVNKDLR